MLGADEPAPKVAGRRRGARGGPPRRDPVNKLTPPRPRNELPSTYITLTDKQKDHLAYSCQLMIGKFNGGDCTSSPPCGSVRFGADNDHCRKGGPNNGFNLTLTENHSVCSSMVKSFNPAFGSHLGWSLDSNTNTALNSGDATVHFTPNSIVDSFAQSSQSRSQS
ncbi:hypothetical protein EVAR_79275_1 [Eumeta japonica]|uniref:Uncharacterized protein n=1 Tax=Eumeta variegata TaxID=151549 RepID=A0A4C1TEJ5_EUMVA|nr:hypothetical protein EVAR_79275_1 [Eumeta japonica]